MKFTGVLLKPLDQQGDRDGMRIDPAGVVFGPNPVPIWQNFGYRVPEDMVGWGTISKAEDGSLIVTGELDHWSTTMPAPKLAIGVMGDDIVKKGNKAKDKIIRKSSLMAVAVTVEHQDPTQPPIDLVP